MRRMHRTTLAVMILSLLLGSCARSTPAPATPPPASSSSHTPTETEAAVQADIDARAKAKAGGEAGGSQLDIDCYEGCVLSYPAMGTDEVDDLCTSECTP